MRGIYIYDDHLSNELKKFFVSKLKILEMLEAFFCYSFPEKLSFLGGLKTQGLCQNTSQKCLKPNISERPFILLRSRKMPTNAKLPF